MAKGFFKIEIDGQQFKAAYLVYVVKLVCQIRGDFYYVGQTGDRNHKTARPAFRRLAGHFSDQGSSTENQIYRQIANKILNIHLDSTKGAFDQSTKDSVTNFLSGCKIEMFVHPLADFSSSTDHNSHILNRQLTERVENELINYFILEFGKEKLLNKKIPREETLEFSLITKDIINHIKSS